MMMAGWEESKGSWAGRCANRTPPQGDILAALESNLLCKPCSLAHLGSTSGVESVCRANGGDCAPAQLSSKREAPQLPPPAAAVPAVG